MLIHFLSEDWFLPNKSGVCKFICTGFHGNGFKTNATNLWDGTLEKIGYEISTSVSKKPFPIPIRVIVGVGKSGMYTHIHTVL